RSNHQKPGRGIAERLRDPSCRRSSDQASGCLAARLQGGAIRGRVCAFLAPEPNIRTLKRGGGKKYVKVFGCSDDCAGCGTVKADRMPTTELSARAWRPPPAGRVQVCDSPASCFPTTSSLLAFGGKTGFRPNRLIQRLNLCSRPSSR